MCLVKDKLIKHSGLINVPITKELLTSCQEAYQKYNAYLQEQKKQEEMKTKREMEMIAVQETSQEKDQFKVQLKQCESDIETLKAGIKLAELALEGGIRNSASVWITDL